MASLTEIITYLPICLFILMAYLTQRLLVIVEMTAVAGELALPFVSLILEPQWNCVLKDVPKVMLLSSFLGLPRYSWGI